MPSQISVRVFCQDRAGRLGQVRHGCPSTFTRCGMTLNALEEDSIEVMDTTIIAHRVRIPADDGLQRSG